MLCYWYIYTFQSSIQHLRPKKHRTCIHLTFITIILLHILLKGIKSHFTCLHIHLSQNFIRLSRTRKKQVAHDFRRNISKFIRELQKSFKSSHGEVNCMTFKKQQEVFVRPTNLLKKNYLQLLINLKFHRYVSYLLLDFW